jgi:phasin family protein
MAQITSDRWLRAESDGFDKLFGATGRYFDAFERLTALNLEAIRFGFAETREAFARTCAADNLPEAIALPVLLAPAWVGEGLSYSRQFFEIMSGLQRGSESR